MGAPLPRARSRRGGLLRARTAAVPRGGGGGGSRDATMASGAIVFYINHNIYYQDPPIAIAGVEYPQRKSSLGATMAGMASAPRPRPSPPLPWMRAMPGGPAPVQCC